MISYELFDFQHTYHAPLYLFCKYWILDQIEGSGMQKGSTSTKPITGFNINPPSSLQQTSDSRTEKSKQERSEKQLMEELTSKQYDNYAGQYLDRPELAPYIRREGRPVITDSLLTQPWIKQTLQEAFYTPLLFSNHGAKLRKSEKFFEFVLGKLAGSNKNLEFLWRKRREMLETIYEVEPPLTERECRQLQSELGKYRSGQIMYQLGVLGVREAMCSTIAQISENNLTRAVQIALQGNIQSHKFEVPSFQRPQDECIFLHQWLTSPQRRLLVVRLSSEQELDLFTLSLRHRCLGLYQMFIRNRRYIERTIQANLMEWRRGGDGERLIFELSNRRCQCYDIWMIKQCKYSAVILMQTGQNMHISSMKI